MAGIHSSCLSRWKQCRAVILVQRYLHSKCHEAPRPCSPDVPARPEKYLATLRMLNIIITIRHRWTSGQAFLAAVFPHICMFFGEVKYANVTKNVREKTMSWDRTQAMLSSCTHALLQSFWFGRKGQYNCRFLLLTVIFFSVSNQLVDRFFETQTWIRERSTYLSSLSIFSFHVAKLSSDVRIASSNP